MKDNKITLPLESGKNDLIGGYEVYDADGDWICDALNEERAALIVAAVNAHEALVEACKAAQMYVEWELGDYIHLCPLGKEAHDKVKAALAKAQGAS